MNRVSWLYVSRFGAFWCASGYFLSRVALVIGDELRLVDILLADHLALAFGRRIAESLWRGVLRLGVVAIGWVY